MLICKLENCLKKKYAAVGFCPNFGLDQFAVIPTSTIEIKSNGFISRTH